MLKGFAGLRGFLAKASFKVRDAKTLSASATESKAAEAVQVATES